MTNHGKVGVAEPRKDMGDKNGRERAGSRVVTVVGHVHWLQAGYGGPVGGNAPYIRILCRVEWLQGSVCGIVQVFVGIYYDNIFLDNKPCQ